MNIRSTHGVFTAFLAYVVAIGISTSTSVARAEDTPPPDKQESPKDGAKQQSKSDEVKQESKKVFEDRFYYQFKASQPVWEYDRTFNKCSSPPKETPQSIFTLSVGPTTLSMSTRSSPPDHRESRYIASSGTSFVVVRTTDDKNDPQLVIQFCQETSVRNLLGTLCSKPPAAPEGGGIPPRMSDNKNGDSSINVELSQYEIYYCLAKSTFDSMLTAEEIVKKYRRGSTGPVYGLNFALPFKLRRAIPGFNTTIDKGIQIAGSLGWRWRISDARDYHLDFPVVSMGLTTLDIATGTAPAAKEGNTQTMGVTASGGIVLELSDFQLGIMMGVDCATGDTGKDWRYNGKTWYSFSVGYSFLKSK
jgi:hypothetical protein